jgi:hypothetical protein
LDHCQSRACHRPQREIFIRSPITHGVIVTDDLSNYKIVAEKLQLGHQVCQFHVRRVGELQEKIQKEWLWMLQLLDVLYPDGSQRLHALWKQLPGRCPGQNKSRSAL